MKKGAQKKTEITQKLPFGARKDNSDVKLSEAVEDNDLMDTEIQKPQKLQGRPPKKSQLKDVDKVLPENHDVCLGSFMLIARDKPECFLQLKAEQHEDFLELMDSVTNY